jgi:hypothetical protein
MGILVGMVFGAIIGAALMRYALSGPTVVPDVADTPQTEHGIMQLWEERPAGYDT